MRYNFDCWTCAFEFDELEIPKTGENQQAKRLFSTDQKTWMDITHRVIEAP